MTRKDRRKWYALRDELRDALDTPLLQVRYGVPRAAPPEIRQQLRNCIEALLVEARWGFEDDAELDALMSILDPKYVFLPRPRPQLRLVHRRNG